MPLTTDEKKLLRKMLARNAANREQTRSAKSHLSRNFLSGAPVDTDSASQYAAFERGEVLTSQMSSPTARRAVIEENKRRMGSGQGPLRRRRAIPAEQTADAQRRLDAGEFAGDQGGVGGSGSDPEIRAIIEDLRRDGFTPREIRDEVKRFVTDRDAKQRADVDRRHANAGVETPSERDTRAAMIAEQRTQQAGRLPAGQTPHLDRRISQIEDQIGTVASSPDYSDDERHAILERLDAQVKQTREAKRQILEARAESSREPSLADEFNQQVHYDENGIPWVKDQHGGFRVAPGWRPQEPDRGRQQPQTAAEAFQDDKVRRDWMKRAEDALMTPDRDSPFTQTELLDKAEELWEEEQAWLRKRSGQQGAQPGATESARPSGQPVHRVTDSAGKEWNLTAQGVRDLALRRNLSLSDALHVLQGTIGEPLPQSLYEELAVLPPGVAFTIKQGERTLAILTAQDVQHVAQRRKVSVAKAVAMIEAELGAPLPPELKKEVGLQ